MKSLVWYRSFVVFFVTRATRIVSLMFAFALMVLPADSSAFATSTTATSTMSQYIEIVGGCGPYYEGTCIDMRSHPGSEYASVLRLRKGMVLKVSDILEGDDGTWYKISFDEDLHYPERAPKSAYVAASDDVRLFHDVGDQSGPDARPSNDKKIIVNLSEEMLYAYDGNELFMQEPISTGRDDTPTSPGEYHVYKKKPTRYMQGPDAGHSKQNYDQPGVPWDLYFTKDGAVIHGAYWHDHFGTQWSHGCVNLPTEKAKILYKWADLGTPVIVRE